MVSRWTTGMISTRTVIMCCRNAPVFLRGNRPCEVSRGAKILRPSADMCVFVFFISLLIMFDYAVLLVHVLCTKLTLHLVFAVLALLAHHCLLQVVCKMPYSNRASFRGRTDAGV